MPCYTILSRKIDSFNTSVGRVGEFGASVEIFSMSGQLFTQYFLTDGIHTTADWELVGDEYSGFRNDIVPLYDSFSNRANPNEAETEQDLIRPVFELLGWKDYLPQQGTVQHERVPDHLLFRDSEGKDQAAARPNTGDRYQYAMVVQESKRFGLSLDSRDKNESNPHDQILSYLETAASSTDGGIRWGLLSNGRVWRLYDRLKRPRSDSYVEFDVEDCLSKISKKSDESALKTFYLLFRRAAFIQSGGEVTTFLEQALEEGRRYEERVAQDLSGVVFDRIYPDLTKALALADGVPQLPEDERSGRLMECRDAALIFLYRVLFILYAEDRGLLPVNDPRYDDYGLRRRVRDDVANRTQRQDVFSEVATNYYDHLTTLFRLIDQGDQSIGLPPYNGGLFASEAAPVLSRVRLSDSVTAPIIYGLSHTSSVSERLGGPRFVNYRDLSVQQLGSIEERLLEREPAFDENGEISVRLNPFARKDSGSYYTPQSLVDLIIDRTVKPLAEERLDAFRQRSLELEVDERPEKERRTDLEELDPAEAVLDLKVLDPAMGSGHFLVTAVDFLSDFVAETLERVPAIPQWLAEPYESPVAARIAETRIEILKRAADSNWLIDEAQLTDHAIIRRMVLKRCIYGVDKNPMAVELAKVSLWLHSFTVGAPLSFLDHHLRHGDSLIGMRVFDAASELNRLGGLFASAAIRDAENAALSMNRIEFMSDADISEVQESAELFAEVEAATADLRGLLDFLCGKFWLTSALKKGALVQYEKPITDALSESPDDAYDLLSEGPKGEGSNSSAFGKIWRNAAAAANGETFLHWEVAFPGVWNDWLNSVPQGGFDAIIGNPPWDRIKLQEVEWFATRAPDIARATTADARRRRIRALQRQNPQLAENYDKARTQAERLSTNVRNSGHYPLLARGDINLYSLFVERATHLIKPDGFVGLLTPSGISSDHSAGNFFRSVSTKGRIAALLDFENRRASNMSPFFSDIDSRFKFCTLILGGVSRRFDETQCGFFLQDPSETDDPDRCFTLSLNDFALVNPNTGTAPIFRSRRDAEITRHMYRNHPVLVDRSGKKVRRVYSVNYMRMIDMTNDSGMFRSAEWLKSEGFYPVGGNCWKRGDDLHLPLYEGKMVQAYDHRAASVILNPENLNRPAQAQESTEKEHEDVSYLPTPLHWVKADASSNLDAIRRVGWTIGFKDVTSPTNNRTMIASVVPLAGFGNTLPVLTPIDASESNIQSYKVTAPLLVANLNALAFDFVARQKVQGQHLNLYIVEQLPVIAELDYDRKFGDKTARQVVQENVLELTYTAHDMAQFARDLGYDGPPFTWNAEKRRHLRARLDALYFHLYGLSREDAAYVMDTFPIVRENDKEEFGRYRTQELVLAYMNALEAGDPAVVLDL